MWNMMQLWSSMKYAFRRISWGKCAWRLRDFLHYNYIAIEFCSCFPFFGSIFLHFLRILIDFYRTTTLGCCILHILSFRIYKLSHSLGPIFHYQVRSTSCDSDFYRVSTVMYSTVHVPSSSSGTSVHTQHIYMLRQWAQGEP